MGTDNNAVIKIICKNIFRDLNILNDKDVCKELLKDPVQLWEKVSTISTEIKHLVELVP